jgi:hypothetical protein
MTTLQVFFALTGAIAAESGLLCASIWRLSRKMDRRHEEIQNKLEDVKGQK